MKATGDGDLIDPQNWSAACRTKNIAILSLLIFTQAWAGSAGSQANEQVSQEFGVSKVAENLSTAMYLFGVGSGSLFAGPISESIGRNPTYLGSTFVFLLFLLGSALTPTFTGQVICRYFVGLFSSATLSINGCSVGDQFRPVKRAFVFPVIAWVNIIGAYVFLAARLNANIPRLRSDSWPDSRRVGCFSPKPGLAMGRVYHSHLISRSMGRGSSLPS